MSEKRNKQIQQEFGKRFRMIRRAKEITLEDLSYKSGVAYSSIAKLEKGEINTGLVNIVKLAEVLKVSPCEFFQE